MRIDLEAGSSYQRGLYLQPHMQRLSGGESYSTQLNMAFPVDQLQSVKLMWFKKKLAFGSNTLLFREVSVEPLYAPSLYEKRLKTKVFCGAIVPTPAKSEYGAVLDINCRAW